LITDAIIAPDSLILRGSRFEYEIDRAVVSGTISRSIEGASTLELAVIDPNLELLNAAFVTKDSDLAIEGFVYRLVQVAKVGDRVTLTFENMVAAVLRKFVEPRKALRGAVTRAQFAASLFKEARKELPLGSRFVTPTTAITSAPGRLSESKRDLERLPGFAPNALVTVKNKVADAEQREVIGRALDTGQQLRVSRKLMVCVVMTGTQESACRNLKGGDRDSVGFLQQRPSQGWPASRVIETDSAEFFKRAVAEDRKRPSLQHWELCQAVQRSAFPRAYAAWKAEAERTVDAYTGKGDPKQDEPVTPAGRFEFRRGSLEDGTVESSWEALGRLAEEVNWRRFVSGPQDRDLYFISDKALMRSRPRARITQLRGGIDYIDFDVDEAKRVNTASFRAQATVSIAEPGSVIEVYGMGVADGRWLVSEWSRGLWDPFSDTTLTTPEAALPEPPGEEAQALPGESGGFASELGTGLGLAGGVAAGARVAGGVSAFGTPRQRVVAAAERALALKSKYRYRQVRPYAGSLFSPEAFDRTDCSAFAILCYKYAGVGDPSGEGFSGYGNTIFLWSRGVATADPQPGDLAFYGPGNTTHVAVYIGDGMCIGFGSDPIKKHPLHYRTDFRGCRTYLSAPKGKEIVALPGDRRGRGGD
jgi:NlpC/P60 family